jgi:hypothetical protein
MKQSSKKLLAREFLFFIIFLGLIALFYIGTYSHDIYIYWESKKLNETIDSYHSEIADLQKQIISKYEMQKWVFEETINDFPVYNNHGLDQSKLWKALIDKIPNHKAPFTWSEIDSTAQKSLKTFFEERGVLSADSFVHFMNTYSYTENEVEVVARINKLHDLKQIVSDYKDHLQEQILTFKDRFHLTLKFAGTLFILLFIIRYMFLGTVWSLKTLRKTSNNSD